MNKLSFLFIILVLFSSNSCKKKNLSYQIKGIIYDSTFNMPMAGAQIIIKATSTTNQAGTTLATLTTDASGNYTYELKREKYQSITISVSKDNYFSDGTTVTLEDLSLDKDNAFNFDLYAKSWVKLHFTSDGTKIIKYFKQSGKNGCTECCPTGEIQIQYVTDESVYCINNGNTIYQIYYDVLGTTNNGTLQVNTVPFDTTELLINY
ncbi:carboxypeptidase regulatory-like domain-containing protein [Fluviicola sp.]|jgi:hypothetical protein|uniref:carboxypeptidase regulatory-like domain-containing protein n=1 Tax=Fluviicola sp. TaxID=1917219 RepID=UPI002822657F|nr:carboxypeptidase regulatory-like domain-containing protein [Fluviicola sp.]MDR0802586.1 carboxypeptidase regulatory-like domain-containing protein [Fluviicola sp.]